MQILKFILYLICLRLLPPTTAQSDDSIGSNDTTLLGIDPSKPADPSLETITLPAPSYRPLITGSPRQSVAQAHADSNATTEAPSAAEGEVTTSGDQQSSSSIMSMADEPQATTTAAAESETTAAAGGEESTTTAAAPSESSPAPSEEETTTAAAAAAAEEAAEDLTTQEPSEEEKANAMFQTLVDAINQHKLLVQNITMILPSFNPPPQMLFNFLLAQGRQQAQFFGVGAGGQRLMSPAPPAPTALYYSDGRPIGNFIGPIFPTTPSTAPIIDVDTLNHRLNTQTNLRLLDASYEPDLGPIDPVAFKETYYAKWDKLRSDKRSLQYERNHIPQAINFNLNIATFPTWNERQSLYPPDRFEKYVRLLGINKGDEVVVYARGPLGGMLQAARVWALFRIYGHDNISILNGGLDAWRRADLPSTNETDADATTPGNWNAILRPELLVNFEELTTKQSDGYCILSRLYWYNFFDARPRNEYFGFYGNKLFGPQRSHIPGSKPFPADELVRSDGLFATPSEIYQKLQNVGYVRSRQSIVYGNSADEASMVILALKMLGDEGARLYNGGLEEIRNRMPSAISE